MDEVEAAGEARYEAAGEARGYADVPAAAGDSPLLTAKSVLLLASLKRPRLIFNLGLLAIGGVAVAAAAGVEAAAGFFIVNNFRFLTPGGG